MGNECVCGVQRMRWACALLLAAVLAAAPAWAAGDPAGRTEMAPSLTAQLLIAAPEKADPRFRRTVIYMVSHDASGAFGIVINRLLGKGPIAKLLQGLELELEDQAFLLRSLFSGCLERLYGPGKRLLLVHRGKNH